MLIYSSLSVKFAAVYAHLAYREKINNICNGTGFGIMSKQHIPMLSRFSCSIMKVAFLVLLCLTAGSQASFLDDLKSAFSNIGTSLTTTFHAVGDQAKVVGQNLLSTAKEQGSQLASQALQSENCKTCLIPLVVVHASEPYVILVF